MTLPVAFDKDPFTVPPTTNLPKPSSSASNIAARPIYSSSANFLNDSEFLGQSCQ